MSRISRIRGLLLRETLFPVGATSRSRFLQRRALDKCAHHPVNPADSGNPRFRQLAACLRGDIPDDIRQCEVAISSNVRIWCPSIHSQEGVAAHQHCPKDFHEDSGADRT